MSPEYLPIVVCLWLFKVTNWPKNALDWAYVFTTLVTGFTLLRAQILIGVKNTLVGVKNTLSKGQILIGDKNTLLRGQISNIKVKLKKLLSNLTRNNFNKL